MPFDWKKAAESKGQPKMDDGWHYCKVSAVYTTNKENQPYQSRAGRYIIVAGENEVGEVATMSLWCTPQAGWKIAAQLSALGVRPEELEEAGVDPTDFADRSVATRWLVGKTGWAFVKTEGKYANLEFEHEDRVPVHVLNRGKPEMQASGRPLQADDALNDEDIPF